jgi:hypothetical protein
VQLRQAGQKHTSPSKDKKKKTPKKNKKVTKKKKETTTENKTKTTKRALNNCDTASATAPPTATQEGDVKRMYTGADAIRGNGRIVSRTVQPRFGTMHNGLFS